MKIIASDFDGTLYNDLKGISNNDMASIIKWRKKGNLFGIITGRDLTMLMTDIYKYKTNFDFFICCTGSVIYDNNLKIISKHVLSHNSILDIINSNLLTTSHHILFFSDTASFIHINSCLSWITKSHFTIPKISLKNACHLQNLLQISLAFSSNDEAYSIAKTINTRYHKKLQAYVNKYCVDIISYGVNKQTALLELLSQKNWSENSLYVLGDSENDIPMLQYFKGFAINPSNDIIKKYADKTYTSVNDFLQEQ